MTRRKKYAIKTIAFVLSFTMILSDLLYAAPLDSLAGTRLGAIQETPLQILLRDPGKFEAPQDFSSLKEIHAAGQKTFIIHVQDAHANLSGQQNLASTLDVLMSKYKIGLVLVEGGTRDDTLTPLKSIATPEVWKKVAKKFLMEGKISGEEYLNLTSDHPMKIMGIEDKELYMASLNAYAELAEKREAILLKLKTVRRAVETLKHKNYPRELLDYEKDGGRSSEVGEKNFEERFKELMTMSDGLDKSRFPNVQKLMEIERSEGGIDFKAANLEQAALAEALGGNTPLPKTQGNKFSQYSFVRTLLEQAGKKGIHAENYPELLKYRETLESFSQIDFDAFFLEYRQLEDEVYKAILGRRTEDGGQTGNEALLIRSIDRYLGLLDSAYHIQMSTREFELFKVNEPDFGTVATLAFVNRKLADLGYFSDLIPYDSIFDESKKSLTTFYDSVSKRDDAFMRNTERILREENAQVAVLIAGGYHTSHLKQLFKEKDYSYAVLTPLVTSETNQAKYEKILLEPVKKEIKTVTANPEKTSAMEDDLLLLKKKSDGNRAQAVAENGVRLAEMVRYAATKDNETAAFAALSVMRSPKSPASSTPGARLSAAVSANDQLKQLQIELSEQELSDIKIRDILERSNRLLRQASAKVKKEFEEIRTTTLMSALAFRLESTEPYAPADYEIFDVWMTKINAAEKYTSNPKIKTDIIRLRAKYANKKRVDSSPVPGKTPFNTGARLAKWDYSNSNPSLDKKISLPFIFSGDNFWNKSVTAQIKSIGIGGWILMKIIPQVLAAGYLKVSAKSLSWVKSILDFSMASPKSRPFFQPLVMGLMSTLSFLSGRISLKLTSSSARTRNDEKSGKRGVLAVFQDFGGVMKHGSEMPFRESGIAVQNIFTGLPGFQKFQYDVRRYTGSAETGHPMMNVRIGHDIFTYITFLFHTLVSNISVKHRQASPSSVIPSIGGLRWETTGARLARAISRRGFFTVLTGGSVAAALLVGAMKYEFGTDRSISPNDVLPPYGDLTDSGAVWNPIPTSRTEKFKYYLERLDKAIHSENTDEEKLRKASSDFREIFFGLHHPTVSDDGSTNSEALLDKAARVKVIQDQGDVMLRVIQGAQVPRYANLFTQLEILRLRDSLLPVLKEYLWEETYRKFDAVNAPIKMSDFKDAGLDPFLRYALQQVSLPYGSNGEYVGALANLNHQSLSRETEKKILEVERWLGVLLLLTPTEASFKQAGDHYRALRSGPVRPVLFQDLKEIEFARQNLQPYMAFFLESGAAHGVPPDFLAAVALANLLYKEKNLTYSLVGDFDTIRQARNAGRESLTDWVDAQMERFSPQWLLRFSRVQDQAADFLAGIVAGGAPTMGLMQIRAADTRFEPGHNVQKNQLWARWGIRADQWSRRDINRYLLKPRYAIEAAAALYRQMMDEGVSAQQAGKLQDVPDLKNLITNGWVNNGYAPVTSVWGPDPVSALVRLDLLVPHRRDWRPWLYVVNATADLVSPRLPYARRVILESGLFDQSAVPATIVNLTDISQLADLYQLAKGRDKYLQDAARRSLRTLADTPNFPQRKEVSDWLATNFPSGARLSWVDTVGEKVERERGKGLVGFERGQTLLKFFEILLGGERLEIFFSRHREFDHRNFRPDLRNRLNYFLDIGRFFLDTRQTLSEGTELALQFFQNNTQPTFWRRAGIFRGSIHHRQTLSDNRFIVNPVFSFPFSLLFFILDVQRPAGARLAVARREFLKMSAGGVIGALSGNATGISAPMARQAPLAKINLKLVSRDRRGDVQANRFEVTDVLKKRTRTRDAIRLTLKNAGSLVGQGLRMTVAGNIPDALTGRPINLGFSNILRVHGMANGKNVLYLVVSDRFELTSITIETPPLPNFDIEEAALVPQSEIPKFSGARLAAAGDPVREIFQKGFLNSGEIHAIERGIVNGEITRSMLEPYHDQLRLRLDDKRDFDYERDALLLILDFLGLDDQAFEKIPDTNYLSHNDFGLIEKIPQNFHYLDAFLKMDRHRSSIEPSGLNAEVMGILASILEQHPQFEEAAVQKYSIGKPLLKDQPDVQAWLSRAKEGNVARLRFEDGWSEDVLVDLLISFTDLPFEVGFVNSRLRDGGALIFLVKGTPEAVPGTALHTQRRYKYFHSHPRDTRFRRHVVSSLDLDVVQDRLIGTAGVIQEDPKSRAHFFATYTADSGRHYKEIMNAYHQGPEVAEQEMHKQGYDLAVVWDGPVRGLDIVAESEVGLRSFKARLKEAAGLTGARLAVAGRGQTPTLASSFWTRLFRSGIAVCTAVLIILISSSTATSLSSTLASPPGMGPTISATVLNWLFNSSRSVATWLGVKLLPSLLGVDITGSLNSRTNFVNSILPTPIRQSEIPKGSGARLADAKNASELSIVSPDSMSPDFTDSPDSTENTGWADKVNDVGATIRTAMKGFNYDLAKEQNVTVRFSEAKKILIFDETHSTRDKSSELWRALYHLLENAIKYSNINGQVDITLQEKGSDVVIEIQDQGIGITPSTIPSIMLRRVIRADNAKTHANGEGQGLKEAVESIKKYYNGSVTIQSEGRNKGTTAVIRFPRSGARPAGGSAPLQQRKTDGARLAEMKFTLHLHGTEYVEKDGDFEKINQLIDVEYDKTNMGIRMMLDLAGLQSVEVGQSQFWLISTRQSGEPKTPDSILIIDGSDHKIYMIHFMDRINFRHLELFRYLKKRFGLPTSSPSMNEDVRRLELSHDPADTRESVIELYYRFKPLITPASLQRLKRQEVSIEYRDHTQRTRSLRGKLLNSSELPAPPLGRFQLFELVLQVKNKKSRGRMIIRRFVTAGLGRTPSHAIEAGEELKITGELLSIRPADVSEVSVGKKPVTRLETTGGSSSNPRGARLADWEPVEELDGKILLDKETGHIRFAGKKPVFTMDSGVVFYFARHGETYANAAGKFQGRIETGENQLNSPGQRQAQDLAYVLAPELRKHLENNDDILVITSESKRAKDTARPVIEILEDKIKSRDEVLDHHVESFLREMAFGICDNKSTAEILAMGDPEASNFLHQYREQLNANIRPQSGEDPDEPGQSYLDNLIEAKKDFVKFQQTIQKRKQKNGGRKIVVVAIGHAIRFSALRVLLGDTSMHDPSKGFINWRQRVLPNAQPLRFDPQTKTFTPLSGARLSSSDEQTEFKKLANSGDTILNSTAVNSELAQGARLEGGSALLQQREIQVTGNSGGAKVVQNDKNGDRTITGDHDRALGSGFGVNPMVPFFPDKFKPGQLKYAAKRLVRYGRDFQWFEPDLKLDSNFAMFGRNELGREPLVGFVDEPLFLQNVGKRSHAITFPKEETDRFVPSAAGFLNGVPAATDRKLGAETDKRAVLLENQQSKLNSHAQSIPQTESSGARLAGRNQEVAARTPAQRNLFKQYLESGGTEADARTIAGAYESVEKLFEQNHPKHPTHQMKKAASYALTLIHWKADIQTILSALYYPAIDSEELRHKLSVSRELDGIYKRVQIVSQMDRTPFRGVVDGDRTIPIFMNMNIKDPCDVQTFLLLLAVKLNKTVLTDSEAMDVKMVEQNLLELMLFVSLARKNGDHYLKGIADEIEETVHKIREPEQYEIITAQRQRMFEGMGEDHAKTVLKDLGAEIVEVLKKEGVEAAAYSRVKTNVSIQNKIVARQKYSSIDEIPDFYALRIVTNDPSRAEEIVTAWLTAREERPFQLNKTEKNPTAREYRTEFQGWWVDFKGKLNGDATHETSLEVQFTSHEIHEAMEKGSALVKSSWAYKLIMTLLGRWWSGPEPRFREGPRLTGDDAAENWKQNQALLRGRISVLVYRLSPDGRVSRIKGLELAEGAYPLDAAVAMGSDTPTSVNFVRVDVSKGKFPEVLWENPAASVYLADPDKPLKNATILLETSKLPKTSPLRERVAVILQSSVKKRQHAMRATEVLTQMDDHDRAVSIAQGRQFVQEKTKLKWGTPEFLTLSLQLKNFAEAAGFFDTIDDLMAAVGSDYIYPRNLFWNEFQTYLKSEERVLPGMSLEAFRHNGARLAASKTFQLLSALSLAIEQNGWHLTPALRKELSKLRSDERQQIGGATNRSPMIYAYDRLKSGLSVFDKIVSTGLDASRRWQAADLAGEFEESMQKARGIAEFKDADGRDYFGEQGKKIILRAAVVKFFSHEAYALNPGARVLKAPPGTIPYDVHPTSTGISFFYEFRQFYERSSPGQRVSAEAVAAAFLHDSLEDTKLRDMNERELINLFGSGMDETHIRRIWKMVRVLTHRKGVSDSLYLDRIIRSAENKLSDSLDDYFQVILIKLADRLNNLRTDLDFVTDEHLSKEAASNNKDHTRRIVAFLNQRRQFVKYFANFIFRTDNEPFRDAVYYWNEQFLMLWEIQKERIDRIWNQKGLFDSLAVVLRPEPIKVRHDSNRQTWTATKKTVKSGVVETEFKVVDFSELPPERAQEDFKGAFVILKKAWPPSNAWQKDFLISPEHALAILSKKPTPDRHALLLYTRDATGEFHDLIGIALITVTQKDRPVRIFNAIAVRPDKRGNGGTHVLEVAGLKKLFPTEPFNNIKLSEIEADTLPIDLRTIRLKDSGQIFIPAGQLSETIGLGPTPDFTEVSAARLAQGTNASSGERGEPDFRQEIAGMTNGSFAEFYGARLVMPSVLAPAGEGVVFPMWMGGVVFEFLGAADLRALEKNRESAETLEDTDESELRRAMNITGRQLSEIRALPANVYDVAKPVEFRVVTSGSVTEDRLKLTQDLVQEFVGGQISIHVVPTASAVIAERENQAVVYVGMNSDELIRAAAARLAGVVVLQDDFSSEFIQALIPGLIFEALVQRLSALRPQLEQIWNNLPRATPTVELTSGVFNLLKSVPPGASARQYEDFMVKVVKVAWEKGMSIVTNALRWVETAA